MYTQKKTIDNAHIVRERDRQRFRELLAVLSLGVPVGLFLLLFTWQNLEVIRLGREATRLQTVRKDLGEENKHLQFDLDRLTSLDSVEKRASSLGFSPTDSRAIVMVDGVLPSVDGVRWGPSTSVGMGSAPEEERGSANDVQSARPSPAPSPAGRGSLEEQPRR